MGVQFDAKKLLVVDDDFCPVLNDPGRPKLLAAAASDKLAKDDFLTGVSGLIKWEKMESFFPQEVGLGGGDETQTGCCFDSLVAMSEEEEEDVEGDDFKTMSNHFSSCFFTFFSEPEDVSYGGPNGSSNAFVRREEASDIPILPTEFRKFKLLPDPNGCAPTFLTGLSRIVSDLSFPESSVVVPEEEGFPKKRRLIVPIRPPLGGVGGK